VFPSYLKVRIDAGKKDNSLITDRIKSKGGLMLYQIPVLGTQRASYSVKDIRQLQKNLREIEPELRKEFVKKIKDLGKKAEEPIKSAIRQVRPLGADRVSGGMKHQGPTGWGIGKPIDSTTVRFRTQAGGKSLTTSLVSVRLNSAAVNIMDMAGRSGRSVGQGKRRSGFTPVVRRTASGGLIAYARKTPPEAGRKFIANLNAAQGIVKGNASRIAWPAVEKDLPNFEVEIDKIIQNYYRIANRKLS
jgi:hypothetical protein